MVRFRLVQDIVSRHHGGNFVWTSDPEERDALWEARKVGSCCRVVPCVARVATSVRMPRFDTAGALRSDGAVGCANFEGRQ